MAMRPTTLNQRRHEGQYADSIENRGPGAYCPDHRTGVTFPDVVVTPLQYVE